MIWLLRLGPLISLQFRPEIAQQHHSPDPRRESASCKKHFGRVMVSVIRIPNDCL